MFRRFLFSLLMLAGLSHAAQAMVLSCLPAGKKGERQIEAYVDGFAEGQYPPQKLDAIRVLVTFGKDIYEFFPQQTQALELRDGMLRIHLAQTLSAGASAEMRFEGKLAAVKGMEFPMQFSIRNERREGKGDVRCTIE
jgi:hypothetical protein